MRTRLVGIGMLLSAFSPLVIVLLLIVRPLPAWYWNAAAVLGAALPLLGLALTLRAAGRLNDERITIRSTTPRDTDVLTFLGSYLVPIVVAFFTVDAPRLAAMLVLLVLLVAVYVGGELYFLNPVLAVAGFRVVQVVDDASGKTLTVLTRRRDLRAGGRVEGKLLSATVLIELGRR